MSDRPRTSWGRILGAVPQTDPGGDKVVPLRRQSLDELEREYVAANNRVVDTAAECERAAMAYNGAVDELGRVRERLAERLKDLGIKSEFFPKYPEAEVHARELD